MKNQIIAVLGILLVSLPVFGQGMPDPLVPQGENLQVPDGWEIRLDKPDESVTVGANPDSADIYFVNMTPGWHLTTGPRGIFYHPENDVEGNYSIHTAMHYFNPNGRNREGYGLFFGGKNLQSDDIEYLYFLIRNTGDYLIKRRIGTETEVMKDWTSSEAIVIYDDPEVSSVLNKLSIIVDNEAASFYINDVLVTSMNDFSSDSMLDGIFGMRVNHSVNLHIEDLGTGTE